MFLAVDIGNTQTTLGLFGDGAPENNEVIRQWRMATNRRDTADELHARLFSYFAMLSLSLGMVDSVAISSVVPILTQEWTKLIQLAIGINPLIINATDECGIALKMPDPTQIGADRIANAVAALTTYKPPVIVVDFGTATNIDVIDAEGRFRGGAIMPGLLLSASALFDHAARLSSVPLIAPPHALGDTTETAVQSGIVIGAAVQAEGIVKRIEAELQAEWNDEHTSAAGTCDMPPFTVVGTGGLSSVVAEATTLFDALDPDLTIRGIHRIWCHRVTSNRVGQAQR
jgi:type III pantothenate kinase